jgi:hypothetical protein
MNDMMKAVEEYIEENDSVIEFWSDTTKELVNLGMKVVDARDAAYLLIFSRVAKVLARGVIKDNVVRNCCGRRFR